MLENLSINITQPEIGGFIFLEMTGNELILTVDKTLAQPANYTMTAKATGPLKTHNVLIKIHIADSDYIETDELEDEDTIDSSEASSNSTATDEGDDDEEESSDEIVVEEAPRTFTLDFDISTFVPSYFTTEQTE